MSESQRLHPDPGLREIGIPPDAKTFRKIRRFWHNKKYWTFMCRGRDELGLTLLMALVEISTMHEEEAELVRLPCMWRDPPAPFLPDELAFLFVRKDNLSAQQISEILQPVVKGKLPEINDELDSLPIATDNYCMSLLTILNKIISYTDAELKRIEAQQDPRRN